MAANTATAVLQLDEMASCELATCNSSAVDPLNIPTDHNNSIMTPADASTDKAYSNSDNKDKLFDLEQCSSTRTSTVFTDVIEIGDGEEEESSKRKKSKKDNKQSKEQTKRNTPKGKAGRPVGSGTKSPNLSSKLDPATGKTAETASGKTQSRANSAKSNKTGAIVSRRLSTPAGQTSLAKYSNPSSVSSVSTDSKSASPSPKPVVKQSEEEERVVENSGPKVPPLKIVIPGGISSGTSQLEGDGGNRKGKSARSSLPHKKCSISIPLEATPNITDSILDKESEQISQTAEGPSESQSSGVVCSLVREERSSTITASTSSAVAPLSTTTVSTAGESTSKAPVKLPPRKRKVKTSKEHHVDAPKVANTENNAAHAHANANSFQMYFNIRKQVERRQKSVFPVQPKPPKGFKDYLMNRCSYVLQKNAKIEPTIDFPPTLPPPMREQFTLQEKERHSLRVQHQVEKEKLVLAVEQEILRVHGRAARALANQALPFSLCTFLRGREVYNMLTPEQEEKERNTQRPRYNGRLFLSWLQEVDDKWEKIKEGMVRRHHNEAESLHAVQTMDWQWKLDELNICDSKIIPKTVLESSHVPMVLVSEDFDLLPD